ncbi:Serine protease SPPA, chloroplastic-like protein, partial [Drosera capensis]
MRKLVLSSLLIRAPPRTMASPLLLSPHLHHIHRLPLFYSLPHSSPPLHPPLRGRLSTVVHAFEGSKSPETQIPISKSKIEGDDGVNGSAIEKRSDEEYPSGEFEMEEVDLWRRLGVKVRMLLEFPWRRVKKGSVLNLKLRGQISDQLKTRFSSGLSLPQICENLEKAAYDPRIAGVYLQVDPLNCGWGKVEEIRRHILDFRKSGKFIIGYVPICSEKEYYLACACEELYVPPGAYFQLYGLTVQAQFLGGVLKKVGIQPQVERIGKYKSFGDQLARTSISEENREMLETLLENIFDNWIDTVSSVKGKTREEVETFINEGVYKVERLREEGFITDIKYEDEVISMMKEKMGVQNDKELSMVDYRKYSRVRKSTVGLSGGKDQVAIIRASGNISRVGGQFSSDTSNIVAEKFIEKIRSVRESKKYKAAIIRIDSGGGDALASD